MISMERKADDQPDFFRNGSFDAATAWDGNQSQQRQPAPPPAGPGSGKRPSGGTVGDCGVAPAPGCGNPLADAASPGTLNHSVPARVPGSAALSADDQALSWARGVYNSEARESGVAVVLWLCLGVFGIHRIYLGRTVSGIAQFLTGGGFLVWWLADIFLLKSMIRDKNLDICFRAAARCGVAPELVAPELFF